MLWVTDTILTILCWWLSWVVPKKPRLLVVGGRQFGGNTRPVLEQAARFGFEAFWLTARPEILALDRREVVSTRSLRGLWLAARARAVLFTHSLGDFAPLRFSGRGTFLFNLWHGMPIKRVSTADPGFALRRHARSNVREMRRYGAMLATSPAMAELFSRTFRLPLDRILQIGQPRTDAILQVKAPALDGLYQPPLPQHSRRILYSPTWREGQPVRLFPFPDYDRAELNAFLENMGAVLFVRTHPNDAGGLGERAGRIVPLQGDILPEITDMLSAFDVLITDYSSIYYDFLLLDRPVLFIPYDLEEYAASPGFYLPFEQIVAGPQIESQRELVRHLEQAMLGPDPFAAERARVKRLVYTHCDSNATSRVLEFLQAL